MKKRSKYLLIVIAFTYLCLVNVIYYYQDKIYKKEYNMYINNIISVIKKSYPQVTNKEILNILNNEKDQNDYNFLNKYGINIDDEFAIMKMNKTENAFLIMSNISFIIFIILIILIFLQKEKYNKDEIIKLTNLVKQINNKNYNLNIRGTDESELSKLKDEIYKTVLMLKITAESSLKDKNTIKMYLEDISHQIKTPLTVINIALDNLIDNPDMDINLRNEFLSKISKELMDINTLVQNLLKLSKFDVNAVSYNLQKVSVTSLIDKSISKINLVADLKNINISSKIDKDFTINIDLNWQIEAIANILKNAIEHSNENEIVYIKASDNNIYSMIEIINKGEIDKKDLIKIFDRFYSNKKTYSDSVGIGLSLAKNIIEKNNGKINVKCENGYTDFIIKYYK